MSDGISIIDAFLAFMISILIINLTLSAERINISFEDSYKNYLENIEEEINEYYE